MNTEQTEVPDFWQHSANPETRNAWLEQENARLRAEIEKAKESYQGLLFISRNWESQYRSERQHHQATARRSLLDGIGRAHSYLVRQYLYGPDKPSGKYRLEGAIAVIDHLGAIAAEQAKTETDVLAAGPDYRHEPEGA